MVKKTRDDLLWETDAIKFPKRGSKIQQFQFILRYAALAPSSHNTQPWKFAVNQKGVQVYADLKRRLKVADPTDKELYISVGCAIANIEVAADHFGFDTKIELFPIKNKKLLVATIDLIRIKKVQKEMSLLKYVTKRMTNRSLYNPKKRIPMDVVLEMKSIIEDLPVKFIFISNRDLVNKLAQITKDGIFAALSDREFRLELSNWVRHNWTKQGDGMPADTMGMPAAASIVAPALVRSSMVTESTSKMEEKMIRSASGVGLLHAKKDDKPGWVNTGRAFERIALLGMKYRVYVAPLSAAIEMNEQKKQLMSLIKELEVPMMFFRMGYPTKKFPHSPRLALSSTAM